MFTFLNVCIIVFLKANLVFSSDYYVNLTSDSPTVRGGTVHFYAQLYDDDGNPASGSFKYVWQDNSIGSHEATHYSKLATDWWNETYPATNSFPPGPYEVQVTIYKSFFIYYPITSQRLTFELTEHLNGRMQIRQKNKEVNGRYISNLDTVTHEIILSPSDAEYLNKTATSILTYWFVDCIYYGITNDYTFQLKYPEIGERHHIEALVVASYEPITTPAPNTTMAPPTTTTTTAKPNITTIPTPTKPTTTIKIITPKQELNKLTQSARVKRALTNSTSGIWVRVNGTLVPYNGSFPFVCINNNTIAPDMNKTYGYFSRKFEVKAPITNFSVTGNYWLHKGDVLNLMVKCQGSPQFYYCKHIFEGIYNVTGNENCDVPQPDSSEVCEFPIKRFLRMPQKYTIVIVIYNNVGKMVSPVTVTVYEVPKQAQLSVIVVPVVSSLVAVVLIVFGVAYYMQNRSRFTVEVADFNFGQQCSDLEYKTFRERLRDSIANAFIRVPTPGSSDPTIWPPGRKYGSLT